MDRTDKCHWYSMHNSCQPPLETMVAITKTLEVDMNELIRFEELPEEKQNTSGAYQSPKYFSYEGKTLWKLRMENDKGCKR